MFCKISCYSKVVSSGTKFERHTSGRLDFSLCQRSGCFLIPRMCLSGLGCHSCEKQCDVLLYRMWLGEKSPFHQTAKQKGSVDHLVAVMAAAWWELTNWAIRATLELMRSPVIQATRVDPQRLFFSGRWCQPAPKSFGWESWKPLQDWNRALNFLSSTYEWRTTPPSIHMYV